jgi:hypothetical protein
VPRRRPRFAASLLVASLATAMVLAVACSDDESPGGSDESGSSTSSSTASTTAAALPGDDLRMNEIQVLGSHNSYHQAAQPEVADALANLMPGLWKTIDYSHAPIPEQLDQHGIRQFELDVFPDPEGGLYATPAALELLGLPAPDDPALSEPGFKVQHVADIDFGSSCVTLVKCLEQIQQWSQANPDHLPIMVMLETKGDDLRAGAGELGVDLDSLGVEFVTPPEITAELFDDLEAEVTSVFPEDQIITPDDVRGDHETLEEAVLSDGWPTLGESRGKVMFSLVDTGAGRDIYTEESPNLAGQLFFTSSEAGRPDAAFIRVDDSLKDGDLLQELAEDGYLIRTRTDEPGVHGPNGDTTLRDSALAGGGNYLSTDYYIPHATTGYVVELPGGAVARCNPVSAPAKCNDADISE